MEELSSEQLYGMLVAVLAHTGPVDLGRDGIEKTSHLALCMTSDEENVVTLYTDEISEDEREQELELPEEDLSTIEEVFDDELDSFEE